MESYLDDIMDRVERMLLEKNAAYGDSAAKPLRVLSSATPGEQILVRMDDKLSRLVRGSDAGEDSLFDLIGYGILHEVTMSVHAPQMSEVTMSVHAPQMSTAMIITEVCGRTRKRIKDILGPLPRASTVATVAIMVKMWGALMGDLAQAPAPAPPAVPQPGPLIIKGGNNEN